jgi:hypothetical protein
LAAQLQTVTAERDSAQTARDALAAKLAQIHGISAPPPSGP